MFARTGLRSRNTSWGANDVALQTVMNLDDEDAQLIDGRRRQLSEPAGRQELTTHLADHNVSVPQTGSGQVPVLHVAHPSRVRFLDDKDDNHHFKTCSARSCARCSWVRHRKRYRKGTTMDTGITDADKASLDPDAHILSLASWVCQRRRGRQVGPQMRSLQQTAGITRYFQQAPQMGPFASCPHVAACRRRGAATGTSMWTHWRLCLRRTDALCNCGSNARDRPTLPQTGCHHRVGAG